jgi:hypothetical protein
MSLIQWHQKIIMANDTVFGCNFVSPKLGNWTMLRKIAPLTLAVVAANSAFAQETTSASIDDLQAQIDALRAEVAASNTTAKSSDDNSMEIAGSKVKFGGFVRLTANQTSGDYGMAYTNGFNPVVMDPNSSKNGDQSEFSASESRVNMEILTDSRFGTVRTFVEVDAVDTIRLRYAFFEVNGFTFGQTDTTFGDSSAWPADMVDFQGPLSIYSHRRAQIAYSDSFDSGFSYTASLVQPDTDLGGDATNIESLNTDRPDMVATIKQSGDWGHVALSGAYTSARTNTAQLDSSTRIDGYAAQIGTSINMPWNGSIAASYSYADGSNEYIYALNGLDGYSYAVVDGKAETIATSGWTVAYNQTLTETISGSVYYSYIDIDNEDLTQDQLTSSEGTVTDSSYMGASAFWQADTNMKFGAEYLYGENSHINGAYNGVDRRDLKEDGKGSTVNLLAQYSF